VSTPKSRDLTRRRKRRAELFAPPKELAAGRPIPLSLIELHLSFGKHQSRDDAAELAVEMQKHDPHVFVQETVDMPEAERAAVIARINHENERARRERAFRDALLAPTSRHGAAWEHEYSREERRLVIDSKHSFFYLVEGYSPGELAEWRQAMAASLDQRPLEARLVCGDIDGALHLEREKLGRFARVAIAAKNKRIVEGFERMRGELLHAVPKLAGRTPLKVLARYGRSHEQICPLLRERGFRITHAGTEAPAVFSDVALNRLSAGESVSDEIIAAALFQDLHSTVFPEAVARRYAEWSRVLHRSFDRVGRVPGFLALLRESAARTGELGALAAHIGQALRSLT